MGYWIGGLTAGDVVTVSLTSSAFQPVAFAQPPGGNAGNWLIDDNGRGGGNAWLTFTRRRKGEGKKVSKEKRCQEPLLTSWGRSDSLSRWEDQNEPPMAD